MPSNAELAETTKANMTVVCGVIHPMHRNNLNLSVCLKTKKEWHEGSKEFAQLHGDSTGELQCMFT